MRVETSALFHTWSQTSLSANFLTILSSDDQQTRFPQLNYAADRRTQSAILEAKQTDHLTLTPWQPPREALRDQFLSRRPALARRYNSSVSPRLSLHLVSSLLTATSIEETKNPELDLSQTQLTMKLPSTSSSSGGSSKGSFAFALSNLLADKMARSLPSPSGLSLNAASRLQARLSNLAGTWATSRTNVAADYDRDWLITRCSSSQMARLDREGGCFWYVHFTLLCPLLATTHAEPDSSVICL